MTTLIEEYSPMPLEDRLRELNGLVKLLLQKREESRKELDNIDARIGFLANMSDIVERQVLKNGENALVILQELRKRGDTYYKDLAKNWGPRIHLAATVDLLRRAKLIDEQVYRDLDIIRLTERGDTLPYEFQYEFKLK